MWCVSKTMKQNETKTVKDLLAEGKTLMQIAEQTGMSKSKAQHYDITGVTVGRIESILQAYKMTYQKEIECLEEKYIITWDIEQSEQYILKAMREGRIQFKLLQSNMRKGIERLMSENPD